jgi:hypothetical protein
MGRSTLDLTDFEAKTFAVFVKARKLFASKLQKISAGHSSIGRQLILCCHLAIPSLKGA